MKIIKIYCTTCIVRYVTKALWCHTLGTGAVLRVNVYILLVIYYTSGLIVNRRVRARFGLVTNYALHLHLPSGGEGKGKPYI